MSIPNNFATFSYNAVCAWGAQQGAAYAYTYGPAMIQNAVVTLAQRQFGIAAGTEIGKAIAPSFIAVLMPTFVAQSSALAAYIAFASMTYIPTIFRYAMHQKNSYAYQNECRRISNACGNNLLQYNVQGEDDLVTVQSTAGQA